MGGVNILTIFSTLVVMAMLWFLMWLGRRKLARVPGRAQVMLEQYVGIFDDLVTSSLELPTRKENRLFLPLITSLFAFLLLSNYMGFFPTHLFEEPAADINCTLSLGLMAVTIATYCGIKSKGLVGYMNELMGPCGRRTALRAWRSSPARPRRSFSSP